MNYFDSIQIKSETIQNSNMIDKRIINKFLVNYFDQNTNYKTKVQILETMSLILTFTEEEKEKIGNI